MPTSGAGPYTLDIAFSEKHRIDGLNFSFRLRSSTAEGSCPAAGSGVISPLSNTLLVNDTATASQSLPQGSCHVYTAEIVNAQNVIISSEYVSIDNI